MTIKQREEIGELLASKREEKHVSIRRISLDTKVSPLSINNALKPNGVNVSVLIIMKLAKYLEVYDEVMEILENGTSSNEL